MLKNRELRVTVAKKTPTDTNSATDDNSEVIEQAHDAVKDLIRESGKIVIAFVVLDTVRKVILAKVTN